MRFLRLCWYVIFLLLVFSRLNLAFSLADISEAVLQIIANADAKFVTENDASGYKGVSYFGFVGGEDSTNLSGSLSIARSDASNNAAGSYALTPSGLSSSNYDISFVNGVYTLVPANQLLVELSETSDGIYLFRCFFTLSLFPL